MSLLLLQPNRVVAAPPSADPLLQFLPPGMTLHSDVSFDSPMNGTNFVDGWRPPDIGTFQQNGVTVSSPEIITESSGGYGPNVMKFECIEGTFGGNNGLGGTSFGRIITAPVLSGRRMYFALRIRFSANYCAHSNDEKFVYPRFTGTATVQATYFGIQQANPAIGGPLALTGQNYDESTLLRRLTNYVIPVGEWVTLCFDVLQNTPNNSDGAARVWLNGTQILNLPAWRAYLGNEQLTYQFMQLDSTRGGGLSTVPVPAGGMTREVDRMVLYTGAQ